MKNVMVAFAALALTGAAASAQVAVSANDGKVEMVDGKQVVPAHVVPDNVMILDLSGPQPRRLATVNVPASVIGPPQSVAISPDGAYALISAATKLDPVANKAVPDNKVSVLDLKSRAVVQTVEAGLGAAGLSFNPAGTLAVVANRAEDTLSVFRFADGKLTAVGDKIVLPAKASPSHVVFTPDGSKALVTRDGDSKISVFAVAGATLTPAGYDVYSGLRPYGIEVAAKAGLAVVANMSVDSRDDSNIALIDLKANPIRTVGFAQVAPSPEGLGMSADGKYIVVSSLNGSSVAKTAPEYHDFGLLQVFRRDGIKLTKLAETKAGHWCQGPVFSADNRKVLLQCMIEKEIEVFSFDGKTLKRTGTIPTSGGPAGIRVAK
jgi:DNA-binding beta-propeller fold protein YncE